MRAVLQRVSEASVMVDGQTVGAIGDGFLMLVGVAVGDSRQDAETMAHKVANMRVFADEHGRMNRSLRDTGGSVLVVSQFTLAANVSRGRRPSFTDAAQPAVAEPLIAEIVKGLESLGVPTSQGRFGAMMQVALVNDGPVTIIVDVNDGTVS